MDDGLYVKVEYPCGYKLEVKNAREINAPVYLCPLHGADCIIQDRANKNGEHQKVLTDLVKGIDRCIETWNSLAALASIHGVNYPPEVISIEKELAAARDLIKKNGDQNG